MTAAAIPYAIAAVGTAAQISAQNDAASERRRILNQQLDANEAANKKSAELVQKEAQNYAPDARQQAMQQAEQKAFDQSQADLAGAGGALIDTAGGAGNVSSDFLKAKADRQVDEGNRLTAVAREAAKARASSLLGQAEAQRRASLAGELQNNASRNRSMALAARQDASLVDAPVYGTIAKAIGDMGASYLANNPTGQGPDYSLATVEGAKLGDVSDGGYFGNSAFGNNAPGSSFWNPTGSRIKFAKG